MKNSETLISLLPPEVLTFKLNRNIESKEVLRVTNITDSNIIFKVKTTQPTWYYVRPNQQVLSPGQSENVVIVLIETEGVRLLDLSDLERQQKVEKHRFLVQAKNISDEEYKRIVSVPSSEKSDEFTKAWSSGNNEDRKNVRLKVNFQYDDKPNIRKNENILSDNAEILKNKLSRIEASIPTSPTNDAIKNDAILSELLALRKKYDSVVEYTVHLTSERDTIISQMEELQKELNRERQKKKGDNVKGATIQDAGTNKKQNREFVSLALLMLVAIVSFVIGKFIQI